MSHIKFLDTYILELFPFNCDKKKILDVACGCGSWGFKIRFEKGGNPFLIGLDIYKPYLKKLKRTKIYNDLICADAKNIPIRSRIFDFVIACEVIEHMKKQDGLKLLKELERVSKGRVILSTPLGFLKQQASNNVYEKHISSWWPKDFLEMHYNHMVIYDINLPRKLELFLRKFRKFFPFLFLKEIIAWKDYDRR